MTATMRHDDALMAEINVTPFTDVLLVLLIIFMILAAVVAPPGFERQLPTSGESSHQPSRARTIFVAVTEHGRIYVDGRATDERRIYADLGDVARRRGNLHVALDADVKAPYAAVIRILDAAKVAGLDDVGFVTL
jgi:biopolymer transport protein ExbD